MTSAHLPNFEAAMAAVLRDIPAPLGEVARYTLMLPAKRLRPLICLEACRAVGGSCDAALPLAIAIELIHGMSLILDDLPCMDDARQRRGSPASHVAFGEAKAILAGMALLSLAFRTVGRSVPPALVPDLLAMLADAAGFEGMAHAQALELDASAISRGDAAAIVHGKTGMLFNVAAVGGGRIGGATAMQLDALGRYADHLGRAFQGIDDLLDESGDTGKSSGRDAYHRRPSLLRLAGLDQALAEVERQLADAAAALDAIPDRAGLAEVLESLGARVRAMTP